MRAVLLAAVVLTAGGAAHAQAATVALVYEEPIPGLEAEPAYSLRVEAASGEANDLTLSQDADAYTVRDALTPLQAGSGCEAVDANTVRCPTPVAPAEHSAFVVAGDGPDRIDTAAVPEPTFVELRGGTGRDSLAGGPGRDLLFGGSARDSLAGGPGNDRLDGGSGNDAIDGGEGIDRVLYDARRVPVHVDLAAGRGGAAGESDSITAVEEILGGRDSDELWGDGMPNLIIGGGGGGHDFLYGRGGDDNLNGYRVAGGPGDDDVGGRFVSCGSGRDLVVRGAANSPRGPFSAACETVLAIFVVLAPDPVARSARSAIYGVACRAPKCTGRLELRDRRGRLGAKRFSLEHGSDPEALHDVRVPFRRRAAGRVAELHVAGPRAYQRDWFRTRLR